MVQNQDPQIGEWLKQGFAALSAGRIDEVSGYCRNILSADPNCVEGHFLVGLAAGEAKDMRSALRAFVSVTKLDPKHAAAWAQLARLFMRMGQPSRAEKALDEAIAAGPKDAIVEDLVGSVSSLLGDQRQAKRWYAKAYARHSDRPAFAINLASANIFLGETDDARGILTTLVERHDDAAQAEWLLSSIVKAEDGARAERLLERAGKVGDAFSAAFLAYAAGKEFEDIGAWDDAFGAFEAGARAKRSTIEYDEQGEVDAFAACHEAFDGEWARRARDGESDPAPIFVVGQPRTGTTLIERIITSHSMAESAGELQQFGLSMRRLAGSALSERWSAEGVRLSAGVDTAALGAEYLRVAAPMRGGAARFVDKLPGNYFYIPLILAALPQARIVHLTREQMDSCFASYKQLFADAYYHSYDQLEMARHHVRYRRLMDHWRALFPGRFLDISYEETVSALEPNARRLIDFLGLPWEDACLEFHKQQGAVSTASAVQVREKAHTRSVGRWRRYEKQLAPLAAALADAGLAPQ